jgi:dTDP-4-dehydrorhamnose 3,5-epimerase
MNSTRVAKIDGVRISEIQSASDHRGLFLKFQPKSEITNSLDSVALSFNPNSGTLRGLHFQVEPFAEEKLVTCIQGSIFDVIVDLRPSSKTFGKWTSYELNEDNFLQVYLPKGIAHGFQTLSPNTIVHYCLSSRYDASSSFAIDPFGELNVSWPIKTDYVSERDKSGLTFTNAAEKYSQSIGFNQL